MNETERPKSASTFIKFQDFNEQSLVDIYHNNMLVMARAVEPSEIIWRNMTGERGLWIIRRFLLFLAGLLVILFGTTPAVILSEVDFFMQTFGLESKTFAIGLVIKYLQPILVIGLNLFLLLLIDWSSAKEHHETHTLY